MAIRRHQRTVRRAHGMTPAELLQASALRWGTATMMAETDEEKAAREKAEADAKATDGKDGEPTEAELAALGDTGKRALDRIRAERDELRAKAETAAEKARKYDELEEANKTEQQRKDEAAKAAEDRAVAAEEKAARLEAVLEAKLPPAWAARLVGKTPEELKADALKLAEDNPGMVLGTTTTRRRTTSDADKGGDGPAGGMSSLIRRAAGRQA